MSLQFIFGNAGSGKSHYAYEYVVRESLKHPKKNFLILVPEQFTMQTQQDLVRLHPRGGIMNIDVLSFVRLAHRAFEEQGGLGRTVLDDEGKNLVLRRVAAGCKEELTVLKGNVNKPGYISEVKSVLSEFTQYGIGTKELAEFLKTAEEGSRLYYKLKDILTLYTAFEEYLQKRYITREELLDVLAEKVPDSKILKNSVAVLDGFTGFTPVQIRLIRALLKTCEKVLVTVEMDARENPYVYRHPYQLFALSKQTVTALVRAAEEAGVPEDAPVELFNVPAYRFRENPEMAFLEQELLRYSGRTYEEETGSGNTSCAAAAHPGETCSEIPETAAAKSAAETGRTYGEIQGTATAENAAARPRETHSKISGAAAAKNAAARPVRAISLHEARNPAAEARFTAETIRRLVREEGLRYRDIAVIAADMNVYADELKKACAAYDIPVFMDHKKSILLNAFVEYLRSLLSMAAENYSYESVFRHLRTGLCGFSDDETDRLENYCLALGIRGWKKWQQPWARLTEQTGEEDLAQLNGLRVRFVEKYDALSAILRQKRKTVRDITGAVYEHFVRESMQEQLVDMEEAFQEQGNPALAKEYAQIYRIVLELFDKLVELLGEETISLKEYCDLLDAGLEEARVGVIPPGVDQVVIGDVQRTRIPHVRQIFFVGANDTLLSGNPDAGGLLSRWDRERFAKADIRLSPGPKEQVYIQKFYLYLTLTKPTERLSVSWAKVSADGKSLRRGYLVSDILRLFPDLPVEDEDTKALTGRELTVRTGLGAVGEGLRDRQQGVDAEWKELYSWFVRREREEKTGPRDNRRQTETAMSAAGSGQTKVTSPADAGRRTETDAPAADSEQAKAAVPADGGKQAKADVRKSAGKGIQPGEWLPKIRRAAFYKKDGGGIGADAAGLLYPAPARVSVTRLERFASCAYAHFLRYGLRLSEREEYTFEALDLGNIAHQALERFSRKADAAGAADWSRLSEEQRNTLADESVDESILEYGNTVLFSTARNEQMIPRIKRLLRRSVWALTKQMAAGDFVPAGFEAVFAAGKIDRIDICEDRDKVYVKVTDYKTGLKKFDITSCYYGLQLQLPVYMNAALALQKRRAKGKEVLPAGIFYYRIQDPLVGREDTPEKVEQSLQKELKLDGLINGSEDVVSHLERNLQKGSLHYPMERLKSGELSARSKALSEEDFQVMLAYTQAKTESLKAAMYQGETAAEPYLDGCEYCDARDICGFDRRIPGCRCREMEAYTLADAIAQMKKEL